MVGVGFFGCVCKRWIIVGPKKEVRNILFSTSLLRHRRHYCRVDVFSFRCFDATNWKRKDRKKTWTTTTNYCFLLVFFLLAMKAVHVSLLCHIISYSFSVFFSFLLLFSFLVCWRSKKSKIKYYFSAVFFVNQNNFIFSNSQHNNDYDEIFGISICNLMIIQQRNVHWTWKLVNFLRILSFILWLMKIKMEINMFGRSADDLLLCLWTRRTHSELEWLQKTKTRRCQRRRKNKVLSRRENFFAPTNNIEKRRTHRSHRLKRVFTPQILPFVYSSCVCAFQFHSFWIFPFD